MHDCRAVRKADKQRDEQRVALGLPDAVKLLPPSAADSAAAALVTFGDQSDPFHRSWKQRRHAIQSQSIFATPGQEAGEGSTAAADTGALGRGSKRKGVRDQAVVLAKRQRLESRTVKLGM